MMYSFSFFDANLLVAGVLLATTAHIIRTTVDEIPATYYTTYIIKKYCCNAVLVKKKTGL